MYWKDKNLFSEELHLEILNLLLWREDKPKLLYPACAPWICGVLVRNLPEVNKKNMLFTVLNSLLGELYLCWKIIRGCANLSDWKTLGVHAENGSFWSHHQHIDETLCCHLMPFSCESLCIGFLKSSSYWKKKKQTQTSANCQMSVIQKSKPKWTIFLLSILSPLRLLPPVSCHEFIFQYERSRISIQTVECTYTYHFYYFIIVIFSRATIA